MTATIDLRSAEANFADGFSFKEPAPVPEPTFVEWFRERVLQSRWITYVLAFYVHFIGILALGAILLQAPLEFPEITLNAVMSDTEPQEIDAIEILTTEIDSPAAEEAVETPEAIAMSASTMIPMLDTHALKAIPDSIAALAIDAHASGEQAMPAQKLLVPGSGVKKPRNAVTAGSFSVWTEPENPDPGESYKIVVQIRMPDGTDKYSIDDLEGVVVGSDGYQKLIPGNARGFLPVENGHVRFEIHIVSADENVEDTVFVKSKVLREAQRLQLRF